MGRLADVLHVSFTIRPEWNPNEPLHPSAIQIEVVESHQISQFAGWSDIVERMTTMIRNDLYLISCNSNQNCTRSHLASGTSWIR
jgi:hypothetical protein